MEIATIFLVCILLSTSYSRALVIYCFGREFARGSFKEEHSTNIPGSWKVWFLP